MDEKKLIGKITHYFTDIGVAVIELEDGLKLGDEISVEGATTNFTQRVDSMQVNHQDVEEAGKGDAVGLKVTDRVREGDQVFKV